MLYKKRFSLSEDFNRGKILLHFGAVDAVARVVLNGKILGEHAGGYLPFSFDITEAVTEGENLLEVFVEDFLDTAVISGVDGVKSIDFKDMQKLYCVEFEELDEWLKAENVEIKREMDSEERSKARLFPTTGGILKTMTERLPDYRYIAIDGTENCIAALRDIERGRVHKCFIEMSACVGSCIGGPVMSKQDHSLISDYVRVSEFAGDSDFPTSPVSPTELSKHFIHIEQDLETPGEYEIMSALRKMGKFRPSDELNCGTCGYNTCRDKAIAICQGKAEISMCLPFLKERAESFSDTIVNQSPNGIIALNEDLEVQQINDAARNIMNIRSASDVLGESVVRILDPAIFLQVMGLRQTALALPVGLQQRQRCAAVSGPSGLAGRIPPQGNVISQ